MKVNVAELYKAGYQRGAPAAGLGDAASIDAQVCAETKCDNCGHAGMKYRPFIRHEPISYRAFAVCPECGYSVEF